MRGVKGLVMGIIVRRLVFVIRYALAVVDRSALLLSFAVSPCFVALGLLVRFSRSYGEGDSRIVVFSYPLWASLPGPVVMMSEA